MNQDRLRIWAARLAAPVAFFVAAFVLVSLVQRALDGDDNTAAPTTTSGATTPTETQAPTTTGDTNTNPRRRFYRVRSGDTLESIAARFETTTDRLIELNPGIDPLALSPGQRIRIRPNV
ncbi:MAG: LysM peptidoglycan-binding domain-containing protein [Gaiellaceae bacterium]